MSACWPIRAKRDGDGAWLRALLDEQWGGEVLIVRGIEHRLPEYPALIAGERDGIAIFREAGADGAAELLLLHAVRPRCGIGTALLAALASLLRDAGRHRLRVTTTNDNLDALAFYQKQSFRLDELRVGAADAARERKPTIPTMGSNGIPIHDEIDLIRMV